MNPTLSQYYTNEPIQTTSHVFRDDYGDISPEEESSKLELLKAMESYSKILTSSKIFEKVFPRQFSEEKDIDTLCSNIQYSKNENDLDTLTKVYHDIIFLL